MLENNEILKILNSNLSKEEKEVQLAKLADEILEKRKSLEGKSLKNKQETSQEKSYSSKNRRYHIDYDNNPLIENNLIEKIIQRLRSGGYVVPMYDLLTSCKRKSRQINLIDEKKLLDNDETDTFITLNNPYLSYWTWFASKNYDNKVEKRIYINISNENIYKMLLLLKKYTLNDDSIQFKGKFVAPNNRGDAIIIYCDNENYDKILDVINQIYTENPEIVDENIDIPIALSKTGIPGVGTAEEPELIGENDIESYHTKIERICSIALISGFLQTCLEHSELADKFKKNLGEKLEKLRKIRKLSMNQQSSFYEQYDDSFRLVNEILDKTSGEGLHNLILDYIKYDGRQSFIDLLYFEYSDIDIESKTCYASITFEMINKIAISLICREQKYEQEIIKNTTREIIENAREFCVSPNNIACNFRDNERKIIRR